MTTQAEEDFKGDDAEEDFKGDDADGSLEEGFGSPFEGADSAAVSVVSKGPDADIPASSSYCHIRTWQRKATVVLP